MGEQLELRLAVGVLLGVLDSREPPSPIRRPHGLIDLLIILSTFALLQFNPAPLGRVAFTFVTSSCRCHPPSLVITLKDDALWIQSNEGKRWFAPVHAGRAYWSHFVEVPFDARSCPAIVRVDVADDVDVDTLVSVIDLCREAGFSDVQVAALSKTFEERYPRM